MTSTNDDDPLSVTTQEKQVEEYEGDEKLVSTASNTLTALKAYKKNRVYGRPSLSSPSADMVTEDSVRVEGQVTVEKEDNDGDDQSIATAQMDGDLFRMDDDEDDDDATVEMDQEIDEKSPTSEDEMIENGETQAQISNQEEGCVNNIEDDQVEEVDIAPTPTRLGRKKRNLAGTQPKSATHGSSKVDEDNINDEQKNNIGETDSNGDDTISPTKNVDEVEQCEEREVEEEEEEKSASVSSTNPNSETIFKPNLSPPGKSDDAILTPTDTSNNPNHENKPSTRELRKMIRELFYGHPDRSSMTVKQFRNSLEESKNITLDKEQKKMMKNQLIELLNSDAGGSSDINSNSLPRDEDGIDSEHSSTESAYEDDGDDESSMSIRKKKGTKKRRKLQSKTTMDEAIADDNANDPSNEIYSTRRKRTPKKSRKPSHLRIHEEMRRKKVLAEAKIRAEEMQAAKEQKLNEEDQKRAQLIAKKFDTNTEEARMQRLEDRIGLLGRLKQKRLDVLAVHMDEKVKKEEDPQLSALPSSNQEDNSNLKMNKNHAQGEEVSSEKDETSDDDNEDDDELELVGSDDRNEKEVKQISARKTSPTSILDWIGSKNAKSPSSQPRQGRTSKNQTKIVAASFSNPRAALRNALRAKQFESGNRWLAKELGYDKSEDHIRECKMIEIKKQKLILAKEEERLRLVHERNERLKSIVKGEILEDESIGDVEEEEEDAGGNNNQKRTIVKANSGEESDKEGEEIEEEDEEVAMARAIESQQNELELTMDEEADVELDNENSASNVHGLDETSGHASAETTTHPPISLNETEDAVADDSTHLGTSTDKDIKLDEESHRNSKEPKSIPNEHEDDQGKFENNENDEGKDSDEEQEEKRPKNAAWKAMLEKEKKMLKKQKSLRKGKTIDDEAEEEDEDEGVAGLEDFGFTVKSKQKADDEDEDDAKEEDFENIVDELSDGEGDEEAGEKARTSLMAQEEKLRHKEVLRRIREGYDGKRGGVAGGSSKRGNLRFDQLVAADNRNDAKRLGLLNDDELDSEDDEANGTGEVEDEEVLIDRMLKDRYLNKPKLPEENFSDSEEENHDEEDGEGTKNEDDEEDKEQERLAKRFAKRARMNRILQLHGDDEEFTQSRLLDEDKDLRRELTKIRTVHGKRVRQISSSSSSAIGDNRSSHSNLSLKDSDGSENSNKQNNILPFGSTLSIALRRNALTKKRKTSFLGGGGSQFNCRSKSTVKRQAVSLGHVVFTEEASNSAMSTSKHSTSISISRGSSFVTSSSKGPLPINRKRKHPGRENSKGSLWSKVSALRSQKRRKS